MSPTVYARYLSYYKIHFIVLDHLISHPFCLDESRSKKGEDSPKGSMLHHVRRVRDPFHTEMCPHVRTIPSKNVATYSPRLTPGTICSALKRATFFMMMTEIHETGKAIRKVITFPAFSNMPISDPNLTDRAPTNQNATPSTTKRIACPFENRGTCYVSFLFPPFECSDNYIFLV